MTANGASINCPPVLDELRVLVVEDDPDTREILTATLEQCGAEVTAVASAREALREIEYGTPAVLVSDLGLPETDGYALIERVRALPTEGGRIPAVAVTAYAGDEHRTRALRAGYQMHLAKPVAPEELVAAVASLARRDGEAD